MRIALLCLAACGHSASTPAPDSRPSCGSTAAPSGFACADHGLVPVVLDGAWTFTGTETTRTSTCAGQPEQNTTAPATYAITFAVNGCTIQGDFPGQGGAGQLDDTSVHIATQNDGSGHYGSHGDALVCADASGTLQFHSSIGWYNCAQAGDQGSIIDDGTLSR